MMFTFEDLNRLDPGGVQTLLRAVDKSKLALALKGTSEGLRDLFMSNMSERAGKLFREDMAALGPVRLKEVEEAQMAMVALAKDMAARGELVLSDSKGGDELVY
jgi:flagellar motor switch protein FliG